jgi:hypothetical protein
MVPEDQEHIEFFFPNLEPDGILITHTETWKFVPYEFLKPEEAPGAMHGQQAQTPRAVLILWLPTEASARCPIQNLATLFDSLTPSEEPFGPSISNVRVPNALIESSGTGGS